MYGVSRGTATARRRRTTTCFTPASCSWDACTLFISNQNYKQYYPQASLNKERLQPFSSSYSYCFDSIRSIRNQWWWQVCDWDYCSKKNTTTPIQSSALPSTIRTNIIVNKQQYYYSTTTAIQTRQQDHLPVENGKVPSQVERSPEQNEKYNNSTMNYSKLQQQQQQIVKDDKPMTIFQRILYFSTGIKLLYNDWLLYSNIQDAIRTKRNAWNRPVQTMESKSTTNPQRTSVQVLQQHIPRRQQYFQIQFLHSIRKVFPTVFASMLPIVGYVPIVLSVLVPYQLLTSHFWNLYEQRQYLQLKFDTLINNPILQQSRSILLTKYLKSKVQEIDSNDRVLNISFFVINYSLQLQLPVENNTNVQNTPSDTKQEQNTNSAYLWDINSYPREYLVNVILQLSLVFPSLSVQQQYTIVHTVYPSFVLRNILSKYAIQIYNDDQALLNDYYYHNDMSLRRNESNANTTNQKQHDDASQHEPITEDILCGYCSQLTDPEVIQACIARGLTPSFQLIQNSTAGRSVSTAPQNDDITFYDADEQYQRRLLLGQYLYIIDTLRQNIIDSVGSQKLPRILSTEQFGLLSLHIPLLVSLMQRQ